MKDMLIGAFIGVVVTVSIEYYNYREPEVYVPEPVLSKCDSIIFANDSIARENHILANRILTYKLGLEQLKMVNKDAADYLINSGNFKFTERW